MKAWQRTTAVVAAVALGAALAYVPALEGDWVWDDANLVQPSPALQDLRGLGRAVTADLYRQAAPRLEASPYWRPLALASFWLDTRLGYAPRALHLGNVVLHALAAALLALVLLRRHRDAPGPAGLVAPALAAAWWALHPVNVEPVAWISCRYDLLTGVALLGLLALPWRPGWRRAAAFGLLFLAGLLSKDGFAALLLVVLVMDWADRRPAAAAAPRWIAIALALGAWWGARAALGIPGFDLPGAQILAELPVRYLDVVGIYFRRALVPASLTISHPYAPGLAGVATGAVVVLLLVVAAIRRRRLAMPAAVFLAGLAPAAIATARFGEIPERYFYVPAIGLALLGAELVAACMAAGRPAVRWIAPAVVALATARGIVLVEARLPDWRTDDALFEAALRVNPEDPQANLHAGIRATRSRQWGEARRALEIAQRADPSSARVASAYAWALLQTGDVAGAVREAARATTLAPYQPDPWWALALTRHQAGDHQGELSAIDELLELSPDYPGARPARALAACEVSGRADCVEAARAGTLR
ncbi:MAG TPA: hypothetical protein VEB43_05230 [Anaeromyxobacter sp.]|nr:hypothetical protein [Anaeromyxobacter sp.]